jgi:hypothetical protein
MASINEIQQHVLLGTVAIPGIVINNHDHDDVPKLLYSAVRFVHFDHVAQAQ